jgi:hypothetical protein
VSKEMPATVEILHFDGTLIERHEFDTNQKAADLMFRYMGQPVDINYRPIGCRPMCMACTPKQQEDSEILLDVVLDRV